jgi:hypothetical protein
MIELSFLIAVEFQMAMLPLLTLNYFQVAESGK